MNLFRDMGGSSYWGLFLASGQEANGDDLRKYFQYSAQQWYAECTEAILMDTHNI